MVSLTYSFPSFLEQLILPYGYKSRDASIFGAFYNVMGIAGGVLVTCVLRKDGNFARVQKVIICLTAVSLGLIWLLISKKVSYWLVLVAMILNGMINISIYSSCFEYAAAITPGIGEATSSGLIN